MYLDLLTKIKNAQMAKNKSFKTPFVAMDMAIAEILVKNNYLKDAAKKGRMPKRIISIDLQYDDDKKGTINGIKFISKPSRHIYASYKDLKPVKSGYGLGIISTSKGIMTFKEAKKMKLGGEILFEIW